MKIDLSQYPELVRGAVEVCKNGAGSVYFKRHTPEMYKAFQPNPKGDRFWDFMVGCTTCVRLVFATDASAIRMVLHYGSPLDVSNYVGQVDIVQEGQPKQSFCSELKYHDFANIHEFVCPLHGSGRKNVTVYLPNHVPSAICELELIDAVQTPEPLPPLPYKILFVGDSITQGYFGTPTGCYAARYAITRNADYANVSLGGACCQHGMGSACAGYEWNELVLAFGTNDSGGRSLEDFAGYIHTFFDELTVPEGATVTVISPVSFLNCPEERAARLEEYRKWMPSLEERYSFVRVFNGAELLPPVTEYFDPDGVHPNEKGMEVYADNLFAGVSK